MHIKSISLSYEKIFVFSISVKEVKSNLGLRLNNVLFPDLEEKYKNIFSYIGIDLKISNLNIVFEPENDCKDFFKEEYELPVLLSIFFFFNLFNFSLEKYLCIGSVSKNGDFLSTKGTFISSKYVLNSDLCGIICPRDSYHEVRLFSNDIKVIACKNILELMNFFNHKKPFIINNSRINFFTPSGNKLVLKNNCILIGDIIEISKLLQRLVVSLTKDQLFEMLSCISFKQKLFNKYSIIRPVIDFQYCFSDFINSLLNCTMSNFDKFNDNLILNKSLFGQINIDFFNALFFNDFPIVYIHNFEFFSNDRVNLIINFFTQKKFSNFKIIFSTNKVSERVKYLENYGFELIKISTKLYN